jgi:hypothetical protein
VNRRSSQLPHELLRSGCISEFEGPASLEGSADGGGVTRVGVCEVGNIVVEQPRCQYLDLICDE